MKNILLASFAILCSLSLCSAAQEENDQLKKQALEKGRAALSKMTKQEFNNLGQRVYKRKPFLPKDILIGSPNESSSKTENTLSAQEFPANMRVPGEFEESQAVLIAWPQLSVTLNAELSFDEPFADGYVTQYNQQTGQFSLVKIAGTIPDTFAMQTPYGTIWGNLADAIQKELPVWILIYNASDSTDIKSFMANRGTPLTNYKFLHKTDGGNAFWMRDCAPIGFYYGENDSIGFLDMQYYPNRPLDDKIPQFLANTFGYQYFTSSVELEGGNFMTDGFGNAFTSNAMSANNADNTGMGEVRMINGKPQPYFNYKKPMTNKQSQDTMRLNFGLNRLTVLDRLTCDGGTGHIDIYAKYMDDSRILISEYPEVYNNDEFSDWAVVNKNINTIQALQSHYGAAFQTPRIQTAPDDYGDFSQITCNDYGMDARGYVNGVFLNKTYIFPGFSNDESGFKQGDDAAKAVYEQILPGYRVVPLDARDLTPGGGAYHCITMQIPAENPILFEHKPITGKVETAASYSLTTIARNRSGMKSVTAYWRVKGTSAWSSVPMQNTTGNEFKLDIPGIPNAQEVTIEYYIEGSSNNGKTSRKPLTAPEGYYTFTYGSTVSVDEHDIRSAVTIGDPKPNPSNGDILLPYTLDKNAHIMVRITETTGRTVELFDNGIQQEGNHVLRLSASNLAPSIYLVSIEINGVVAGTRKISVY